MIVRRYPRKMLTALTAGALFVMATQASAATKWKIQPTPNPGGGVGYPQRLCGRVKRPRARNYRWGGHAAGDQVRKER